MADAAKVLHVVRQFSPSVGGMEEMVLNLARAQREQYGIDARVVTLDRLFSDRETRLPRQEIMHGVPVDRIPWRGSTRYPIAPAVLPHARRADVLHVHGVDFFADYLALTKFIHRRPMVLTTHGGFFHTPEHAKLKQAWFSTITRRTLPAYRTVIAVSEGDALTFSKLKLKNLVHIDAGVNIAKFQTSTPQVRDPHRLLYIGRFSTNKNIPALLHLLASLRRRSPEWTLVVAGVEWGVTAQALTEQARELGIGDSVRIIVGASDAELSKEAATATWFACASLFEGFGIAAVEAAGAGLIPVLSRIPSFEKLVATLQVGMLFEPDAPDPAADDLCALAAAMAGRFDQIRAELVEAVAVYDWAHTTSRIVSLYEVT